MSRIGKTPIELPKGVTASIVDNSIRIKGPKGELEMPISELITAHIDGDVLTFTRDNDRPATRSHHGMMRAMANNFVTGVTEGFQRKLLVQGVGYRAEVKGKTLVLNLGYSHPVEYPIPDDIQISAEKDGKVTVAGIDKQRVGQVAAILRKFRPPDRYKGKGVRYEGEHIALKEGKSA